MEDDNDEKHYSNVRGNFTKGQLIVRDRCKYHTPKVQNPKNWGKSEEN
jgi:hypothetical protein